jgi:hypothetical protein
MGSGEPIARGERVRRELEPAHRPSRNDETGHPGEGAGEREERLPETAVGREVFRGLHYCSKEMPFLHAASQIPRLKHD